MTPVEEELLRELDAHDALIGQLVRGQLAWEEFDRAYDNFYPRYPLDGHESDAAELLLFEKYERRIALQRKIWDVFTKIKSEQYLARYPQGDAGFVGIAEAMGKIALLAREDLTDPNGASLARPPS